MITLGSAPLIGGLARRLPSNHPLALRIAGAHLPGRACGCAREVGGFAHYGYLLRASQSARSPHPQGSALGSSNMLLSGGSAEVLTWPGMPHDLVACTVSTSRNVDFPAILGSDWHEAWGAKWHQIGQIGGWGQGQGREEIGRVGDRITRSLWHLLGQEAGLCHQVQAPAGTPAPGTPPGPWLRVLAPAALPSVHSLPEQDWACA